MSLEEKLIELIQSNDYVSEEKIDDIINNYSEKQYVSNDVINNLIYFFNGKRCEEYFWDNILLILDNSVVEDVLFDYLIKKKISLITLSHIVKDDDKLIGLGKYCEEALFTVFKHYYTMNIYTVYDFANLLNKYFFEGVAPQLFLSKTDNRIKQNYLYYFIDKYDNCSIELKQQVADLIKAGMLEISNDEDEIKKAYNSNNYIFNLAVSKNIFTPIEILEELMIIKNIKYSSKIRENSKFTIKLKTNFNF